MLDYNLDSYSGENYSANNVESMYEIERASRCEGSKKNKSNRKGLKSHCTTNMRLYSCKKIMVKPCFRAKLVQVC